MKKIILKGGTLVSARGIKRADVLISGEKIVAVGRHLSADAQTVDVSGKLIFPGFIDACTHFALEAGDISSADDFDSGSKSALAGGVTTVVNFATQNRGESLSDTLNNWHVKAFANSSCDYAFHMAVYDWREDIKQELPAMFEQGVTSFKVNMINDTTELSDREIYEIMTELKKYGGIVGCQCENAGIIAKLREEALSRCEVAPIYHAKTRPDYTEAEAVHRFLTIAKAADVPCFVDCLNTKAGYEEILRARRKGVKVYVETCPQYLLLDDSVYTAPFEKSARFVCSPPLRKTDDNHALWEALKAGHLDIVSSDHCSFTMEQKTAGENDFTKIPSGMPGVQTRAVLLYTYGVKKHRLTLPQMCAYLSENPARLYGMYPKKGAIKAGSDEDLVIFNPKGNAKITAESDHGKCGYTPYEDMRVVGGVEKVYLRGRLAYNDGEIVLEHSGRYVSRGKIIPATP